MYMKRHRNKIINETCLCIYMCRYLLNWINNFQESLCKFSMIHNHIHVLCMSTNCVYVFDIYLSLYGRQIWCRVSSKCGPMHVSVSIDINCLVSCCLYVREYLVHLRSVELFLIIQILIMSGCLIYSIHTLSLCLFIIFTSKTIQYFSG